MYSTANFKKSVKWKTNLTAFCLKNFETFSMEGEQNIAASIFVFEVTKITPGKHSDCFITLFLWLW